MKEKIKGLKHQLTQEYKSVAVAHRNRRNTVINNTEAIDELFTSQKNLIGIIEAFIKLVDDL